MNVGLERGGMAVDAWEQGAAVTAVTISNDEMSADAARDDEESEGFWRSLKERLISWPSMRPPLRLITGVAIAQLLAAGLIVALHGVGFRQINLGLQSGRDVEMAQPYFWISIVFAILAIAFLMTGALLMRWPLRLLALAIFSAFIILPIAPASFTSVRMVVVALIWLWGAMITVALADPTWGAEKRDLYHRLRTTILRRLAPLRARLRWVGGPLLPARTLAILLLALAALYLALLATTGWMQGSNNLLFQLTIGTQLQTLSFALVPFLFLAGSDFAELGELLASGLASATRAVSARRSNWLTLGLTVIVAATIAYFTRPTITTIRGFALAYGGDLLLATLVGLALFAVLRWGRAAIDAPLKVGGLALLLASLGYFALAWCSIAYAAAHTPSVTNVTIADYAIYTPPVGTTPSFSVPYPADWKQSFTQSRGDMLASFNGLDQTFPGAAFVAAHQDSAANADTASQTLSALLNAEFTTSGSVLSVQDVGGSGSWRELRYTLTDPTGKTLTLVGEAWSRALDGRDWAIIGLTTTASQSVNFPVFDEMASAWRPDLLAKVPDVSKGDTGAVIQRIAALFLGLLPLLLGLALGYWMIRRGAKHERAWQTAGAFVAALGLLVGAQQLPNMLQALGLPYTSVWFTGLDVGSLLQAVAIATLAFVIYVAVRRRGDARWIDLVRLALRLNVGLLFVWLMLLLYDRAIELSKSSADHPLSWAAALIVLIALGWDLLMSGESFTNRDDERLPRHTRLLLYLGYIMLTATLVMYFSAQQFTHSTFTHESLFESEPWPQLGLQILGLPMVVAAFALGVVAWLGGKRDAGEKQALEATEAPSVAGLESAGQLAPTDD